MPERVLMGLALYLAAAVVPVQAAQGPSLGVPLTPEQLSSIDLTVTPDGDGLPPGNGNAATGAGVYAEHCQACHGVGGRGGPNDALTGGRDSLAGASPLKTVGSYWPYATTLFDYVRRAMPYQAPGSLSADEVYAVTAFLLFENGIIGEGDEMNAASLPAVTMPNRNGFRTRHAHGW
jgi:cytochrome c